MQTVNRKRLLILTVVLVGCIIAIGTVVFLDDSYADDGNKGTIIVTVSIDGQTKDIETPVLTVEEFLKIQGIPVRNQDITSAEGNSILYDGQDLVIQRVTYGTEEGKEEIPFTTKNVEDNSITEGESKVKTPGVAGEVKVTYDVVYADGEPIKKTEKEREVVKESVEQVVHIGTKPAPKKVLTKPVSKKVLTMTAVAYSLPGRTALGLPVGHGIIAVDPSVIPLGTRVYVEGYGEAIAADVGSGIVGNKIDLWMPTYQDACNWGSHVVSVYIL